MIKLYWDNCSINILNRITEVFSKWENTPYMRDQLCRGIACDCVTFAYGFYCDLFKFDYKISLPKFSLYGINNTLIIKKLIRLFKEKFFMKEWNRPTIQPGDLIAARTDKGCRHVFIIGSEKNMVYHCNYDIGVTKSGFSEIKSKPYILKSTRRELWV